MAGNCCDCSYLHLHKIACHSFVCYAWCRIKNIRILFLFDIVNVNDEFEMIDITTDCEVPSGSNKSPVQLKPALPDALRTPKNC